MTEYVKSTNFASKDSLASGNPLKIVKGTEIDIEFNNIATAITSKADLTSPTFGGTVTAGGFNGNLTGNASGSAGSVATTNWTISQSGSKLVFSYNGAAKFSIDSSGNMIVTGNVTGYGTP